MPLEFRESYIYYHDNPPPQLKYRTGKAVCLWEAVLLSSILAGAQQLKQWQLETHFSPLLKMNSYLVADHVVLKTEYPTEQESYNKRAVENHTYLAKKYKKLCEI